MSNHNKDKEKSNKVKLSPLKISNLNEKTNLSESKKVEINQDNSSNTYLNSIRYLTTYDESSFESKIWHLRKPYKVFLPIRTTIKKIKNNRKLILNSYYKKSLKNDLFLKDIIPNEAIAKSKVNFSETFKKIPKIKNNAFKYTFDNSKSNMNSQSKNAYLSTQRTSTIKDNPNITLSNISKFNNYNQYNIFSYNYKKKMNNFNNNNINNIMNFANNNTYNKINKKSETSNKFFNKSIIKDYNEYKSFRFLNINQGYKNLPNLKNCVNNFTNEIKNLSRERFMNYCLKEQENTAKDYREGHNENFKMEIKKKLDNKSLFDIFYKDYNTYYNKLKKKEEKDNDKRSLLNWEIISYKNEVNRLNIRKDKLLARLNKYIKMKEFLIVMRNYSLDKKDDRWIFDKTSKKEGDYNTLIKERRIKEPEESPIASKKFKRRGSIELQNIGKLDDIKIKDNNTNKLVNRKLKRLNTSSGDKNPLLGSAVKEISTILNNHIANLLIYHNQLRIELEPLKQEFHDEFISLKESDEKRNELLKLQFLIFPEKKRIVKERNDFLENTLTNIKNTIYNSSSYNKMYYSIQEKLNIIYMTLINIGIINFKRIKASLEGKPVEKILFYLKNIETGLNILIEEKQELMEKYPNAYNDVIKDINEGVKIKALEAQRKKEINLDLKKMQEILNRANKSFIKNRRKDYYQYGYKKSKKKIKKKIIDPYDELRYSDDNEQNDKEN